jgi:hypothetical protein
MKSGEKEETPKAHDLLPAGTIGFGEAYDMVLSEILDDRTVLDRGLPQDMKELLSKNEQEALRLNEYEDARAAQLFRSNYIYKEIEVFFRTVLRERELTAYVRDPEDGSRLQLTAGEWSAYPLILRLDLPETFHSNFLDDYPLSGNPNTFVRGARRPVFFDKGEFETWFNKVFPKEKHAGGRPAGSGSYAPMDEPLILEMDELIKSKKAKSPTDAARIVAPKASGAGTLESKQRRLRIAYRQKFPDGA